MLCMFWTLSRFLKRHHSTEDIMKFNGRHSEQNNSTIIHMHRKFSQES